MQEASSNLVSLSSLSSFSTKTGLGIIQGVDSSALPEKILSPETDLNDKDGTGACSLLDYLLLQSLLPKRSILREVVAEVIGKAIVVVVVDDTLSRASSFLSEVPNCSRSALSNLTGMGKRGRPA